MLGRWEPNADGEVYLVGWWYLRFFQPHGDGEFRGDRSETFAFIYWFPPPVR
jgi:hypothetical protein